MIDPRPYVALRKRKGESQSELAKTINVTQGQYSGRETGRIRIAPAEARKLDKALALGTKNFHDVPAYALCLIGNDGRDLEPLYTPEGTLGLYDDRAVAEAALHILRIAGYEEAVLIPMWLDAVGEFLTRRYSHAEAGAAVRWIDTHGTERANGQAAGEHGLALLATLNGRGSVEELAQSLAKAREGEALPT